MGRILNRETLGLSFQKINQEEKEEVVEEEEEMNIQVKETLEIKGLETGISIKV